MTLVKSNTKLLLNQEIVLISAETKLIEDPVYQSEPTKVFILYEQIPKFIELPSEVTSGTFTWLTLIQHTPDGIDELFQRMHEMSDDDLLEAHTSEWNNFWEENAISVGANDELTKSIYGSLYAIASSLPSLKSFSNNGAFYGLSPSGLGLGGPLLEGYHGHSFWDTETWMHPAILLLQPKWSQQLLNYRFLGRIAAYDNAENTGYNGLRLVNFINF